MKLSEWVQLVALLVQAAALSWALGAAVATLTVFPQFAWPVGLTVFALLLFTLALLTEWKSGGRL